MRVSASTWAPPVTSNNLPIITPNPTSKATDPIVSAKPKIRASGMSPIGKPAASAVSTLTSTSATKACRCTFMIKKSNRATAAAAMSSKTVVL